MADGILQQTLATMAEALQQLIRSTAGPPPAPLQPTHLPVPVLPTPPITAYTSARTQALPPSSLGHPVSSSSHPASAHQPMLGVAGLGIHMGGHTNNARMSSRGASTNLQLTAPQISHANAHRQQAIASHFPPTPSLVTRGPRRRGNAVHPPALPRGPATLLETVSSIDPVSGIRMMRIKLEVHPFQVSSAQFYSSLVFLNNVIYNYPGTRRE